MRPERASEELLRAVADRYSGLRTYRDAGRVRRGSAALLEFRTLFARDLGLRFELTRDGRTEIFGGAAGDTEGLIGSVARATGISMGVALTIPALLLPAIAEEAWSLRRLAEPKSGEPPDDEPAPAEWTWLAGRGWRGQPFQVAIEAETLLIRRVIDPGTGTLRPRTIEFEPDITTPVRPDEVMPG